MKIYVILLCNNHVYRTKKFVLLIFNFWDFQIFYDICVIFIEYIIHAKLFHKIILNFELFSKRKYLKYFRLNICMKCSNFVISVNIIW